jgi:small neutral amino acid transporter SnatA (MarC family)
MLAALHGFVQLVGLLVFAVLVVAVVAWLSGLGITLAAFAVVAGTLLVWAAARRRRKRPSRE